MFTKPQKRQTLERQNPVGSFFQNDIIIRISVTTALIIMMLIFLAICFMMQPMTYGFLNW